VTTPTITLKVPNFSIFTDAITQAKSLQFDVKVESTNSVSNLQAFQFDLRISGFPSGFSFSEETETTTGTPTSTWISNVNTAVVPLLDTVISPDFSFAGGNLDMLLSWSNFSQAGSITVGSQTLLTVKVPLGNLDLSTSIFKLDYINPTEALAGLENSGAGIPVPFVADASTPPLDPAPPKLTSITSKVGGVAAADGIGSSYGDSYSARYGT